SSKRQVAVNFGVLPVSETRFEKLRHGAPWNSTGRQGGPSPASLASPSPLCTLSGLFRPKPRNPSSVLSNLKKRMPAVSENWLVTPNVASPRSAWSGSTRCCPVRHQVLGQPATEDAVPRF